MQRKCSNFEHFTLFVLFLWVAGARLQNFGDNGNFESSNHTGCAYLQCESDEACVHRKFRCKDPPCPSMLYCAKSRTESLRGPSTCNTVHCSQGYLCILKVRRCRWDERCKQQIARCVSRKEYHEGPAFCAGFKCPQGNHCILRESFCVNPPCKLLKSCAKNKEVQLWFGKCRSLGCPSEFECFLRRPGKNCSNPPCKHAPDCVTTTEDEKGSEHCRGWICPRLQKCSAEVVGSCETDECDIRRTCQETRVVAANDSLSFSRRSLHNEDDVPSQIDDKVREQRKEVTLREQEKQNIGTPTVANEIETTKTPWTKSEENAIEERAKTLHTWMNHLKSKTELDAIELWIKNAEGRRDFKQFQDWLRSVKDILGPVAYARWLHEILASTSRAEEFRKWLRASHVHGSLNLDKIDVERKIPIFPGREEPQNEAVHAPTKNRYSPPDAQHPVLGGAEILSPQLPNVRNTHGQPYYTFPTRYVEQSGNSQLVNHDPDSRYELQNQRGTTSQNGKLYDEQGNSFPFNGLDRLKNLTTAKDESLSLWTGSNENFEEKSLAQINRQDYSDVSEDNKPMDRSQYLDDFSTDLLEKFMKFLQFSSIEDIQHTLDETSVKEEHQDNSHEASRTEEHDQSYYLNPMIQNHDYEDAFTIMSTEESTNKFPPEDFSVARNFANNFEPNVSNILFNKLGNVQTLNQSGQLTDSVVRLKETSNENSDAMDLNLFLETNKHGLSPYVQSLMKALNRGNERSNNAELNSDESSMRKSFASHENSRDIDAIPKETSVSHRVEAISDSRVPEDRNPDDSEQSEAQRVSTNVTLQQEEDSRTSSLIYEDEEHAIRSFHDVPSYGASDNGGFVVADYAYESNRNSHPEKSHTKHTRYMFGDGVSQNRSIMR